MSESEKNLEPSCSDVSYMYLGVEHCHKAMSDENVLDRLCEPIGQLEMVGQQFPPPISCQHFSGEGCLQPGSRARPVCFSSVRGTPRMFGGVMVERLRLQSLAHGDEV